MAQLEVHRNLNRKTSRTIPYPLDVQADSLAVLATRVVVPLISADKVRAARRLNPEFTIGEHPVVMSTAELAGIPARVLGDKVASLKATRNEIVSALDLLFTGA